MFPVAIVGNAILDRCFPKKSQAQLAPKAEADNAKTRRIQLVIILGDAMIAITTAALGVLGLLAVIQGMPPAASYSLIGVSGFITTSWLGLSLYYRGSPLRYSYNLIKSAITGDGKFNFSVPKNDDTLNEI